MKLGDYFRNIVVSALFATGGCATTQTAASHRMCSAARYDLEKYDMRAGLPDLGKYATGKVVSTAIADFDENGDGTPDFKFVFIRSDRGEEVKLKFKWEGKKFQPYPSEVIACSTWLPFRGLLMRRRTTYYDLQPDGIFDRTDTGFDITNAPAGDSQKALPIAP